MAEDHGRSKRSGRAGNPSASSVLTPPTGLPAVPDVDALAELAGGPADRAVTDAPAGVPPAPVLPVADPGACGHGPDAHEHYRPGTDCGACGIATCAAYRPQNSRLRRLRARLRRR